MLCSALGGVAFCSSYCDRQFDQEMSSFWKSAGSGSQPSVPVTAPAWWPRSNDGKKTPVTHLFRSMRPDLDDLVLKEHSARKLASDSDEMRVQVLRSVASGSEHRSPFLHASLSLTSAHTWMMLGRSNREEDPQRQLMARIDIWSWYQSGEMAADQIIDLSNMVSCHRFFTKAPDDYGEWFADNFSEIRRAYSSKEVLLKWRGSVPLQYIDVVEEYNGSFLAKLSDLVGKTDEKSVQQPAIAGSQPSSSIAAAGSQPSSRASSSSDSNSNPKAAKCAKTQGSVEKPKLSAIAQDMRDRIISSVLPQSPPAPKSARQCALYSKPGWLALPQHIEYLHHFGSVGRFPFNTMAEIGVGLHRIRVRVVSMSRVVQLAC